jgi:hypothetical protein
MILPFTSTSLRNTFQNRSALRRYNITASSPYYFPIGELLTKWNPDDTNTNNWLESPAHPTKNKHIQRFDFSNDYDMEIAYQYRIQEIPFIIYNVPALKKTVKLWTNNYLIKQFGSSSLQVEQSETNHFTYFTMKRGVKKNLFNKDNTWKPPQKKVIIFYDITNIYLYIYHIIYIYIINTIISISISHYKLIYIYLY